MMELIDYMKIPMPPPKENKNKLLDLWSPLILANIDPSPGGEYLPWDKLRFKPVPYENLSSEQWWFGIKLARRVLYNQLPFNDKNNRPFLLALPRIVLQQLRSIDRKTANAQSSILNTSMENTYLMQSLIGEAITSSQLEGASTTRKVAKEMLLTNRKPRDLSERMIFNNYHAMQFVQEIKNEKLTVNHILELHRILTQNTLENPKDVGMLRTSDDVQVTDNTNQTLHVPPKASTLKNRLEKLCEFANTKEEEETFFVHPIIKAILLHFMLAYDHPFIDGNGRTARALFYWFVCHQAEFKLLEFVSISKIIKESPFKYARAYLDTEMDENDTTYFIIHQLDVILKAIGDLHVYIDKQNQELNEIARLLDANVALQNKLNYRQIALIKHALKHPDAHYKIEIHRHAHHVTYDTARTDLLNLVKLNLLLKQKRAKAFVFIVPADLKKRLK